jgi:hypothetical protein
LAFVILGITVWFVFLVRPHPASATGEELALKPFWFFSLLCIFILVLSLGLSNTVFYWFNWLYFQTPLSYTLRESGKFYSLFLVCFGIILTWSVDFKGFYSRFVKSFLILMTLTNLIFGIATILSLNYLQYPRIIAKIDQACQGHKTIFIPNQSYIVTSYSQNRAIINHWNISTQCGVTVSGRTTIAGKDLTLSENGPDAKLESLIKGQTGICKPNEFVSGLQQLGYDSLIIEKYAYPDLFKLYNCLKLEYQPVIEESTISYWEF